MILILSCYSTSSRAQEVAIKIQYHRGHSHNDYKQEQPLLDALRLGYRSIEADIHPCKGHLKVCHNETDILSNEPDLDRLYLTPLDSIINANDGFVYPGDSAVVILMIDLKTKKKKSIRLLRRLLKKYKHLLYQRKDGIDTWGPIQILLSGDPDLKQLERLALPYLFIDGRFEREYSAAIQLMVTRISGNYNKLINRLPKEQRIPTIKSYVKHCQDRNQKLRFWATSDNEETWNLLTNLGVDWIGVDDLEKYHKYHQKR